MSSWWMMRAHMCLCTSGHAFPLDILLLPLHPGSCPLCEGCVRLWFWFSSSPQICSWLPPGESHAQAQLLLNKWQTSLSATLPIPLPSLSLLSLQLKFNTTQQFLVPPTCLHSVYSHDIKHDHLFHPASTSFFSVLIFGQAVWFFLHDIDRKQTGPIHSPS